ncbi:MAG: ABC transporter ATP-binding protein [Tissierellia bacterium]|nr:ABC transporter ATP-binding protein [Tissierellia bacterium]
MKKFLKNYFQLTDQGARDMQKSILTNTFNNLTNILSFWIIFQFINDSLTVISGGEITYKKYFIAIPVILMIRFFSERIVYDSVYTTTYKETSKIRIDLAKRLGKLPLSFFEKKDLADLSKRILGDMEALEHAYSHAVPQFFGGILSSIIIFFMILSFQWKMAIAIFWPLPISLFSIFLFKSLKEKREASHYYAARKVTGKMQEMMDNILPIKTYGRREKTLDELQNLLDDSEKTQMQAEYLNPLILAPIQSLYRIGMATILWVGFSEYAKGNLPLPMLLQFIISSTLIYTPIEGTMANILEFLYIGTPVKSVGEILNMSIMEGEKKSPKDMNFHLENISFSYDGNHSVIKNLSTEIRQGEVTALVGPSGCGKSTLTKLMLRFYDIDGGKMTLGGEEIKTWDPEDLLQYCSMVFQDVILFNNTIMENIRLGRADASDEEVLEVAKVAQVDEFVKKLPHGYQTIIGESGRLLSGGERQRISIARALLKDAPIIFLDESTASVDADSETKIQEALSKLIKDKTVIIIAHRLRTVMNADKIIVMEDGEIVEEGSAKTLLAQDGVFKKLVELQQ